MAFFAAPKSGFFLLPDFESIDLVSVWGSFANGSAFTASVPASKAIVMTGKGDLEVFGRARVLVGWVRRMGGGMLLRLTRRLLVSRGR